MEVYARDLPPTGTQLDTKLALITAISKVVHHAPVLSSEESKANFKVDVRRVGHSNQQHNLHEQSYSRLINNNQPLIATITFPSSDLGQRFLAAISHHPIQISHNLIHFEQSLRNGRKIIPHPQLIKSLKESRFKETNEVIQELKELETTQKPIPINLIDFGRVCQHLTKPAFSSEYAICLPVEESSHLRFDIDSKLILLNWIMQDRAKKIVIQLHTLRKIEACSPWVILSLARPPQFEELMIDNLPTHFSVPSSSSSSSNHHKQNDGLRRRVHGYPHTQADVFPFVNNQLRIQFSSETGFRNFCSLKISVPLPKITSLTRTIVEKNHYDPERIKAIHENLVCFTIPVAFQIESLLHNSILLPYQILRVCKALIGVPETTAERALILFIENYNDDHSSCKTQSSSKPVYLQVLHEALRTSTKETRLSTQLNIQKNEDTFPCRTVTITPTRLSLQGPQIEQSNSILRLYQQTENFLRVSLADEMGHRLRSSREVDIHHLLRTRYRPFLTKGMILCGRKFEFLGYSNSALKDHQAWFVCPFHIDNFLVNAASIRAKLGDFTKVIRIPARYMARIAQAFTSTRSSLTLRPSEIVRIEDVERNGSCFTDGVGTISKELIDQVHRVLNRGRSSTRTNKSTCYQIRLGGFKGMLSLDPTLSGKVVKMRPSMDKFDAPDSLTLDIAGTFTRPLVAYLNRPLIKLLEDLGIQAEVFLNLQDRILKKVENSRSSPNLAADLIEQYSIGTSSSICSILRKLGVLLGEGISIDSDFIEECYDLMIIQSLRDLKYRGRIPIKKSYTLVGVADEDNLLGPDSIYVCVQHVPRGPLKYLKGTFAVTRSPSLHPGDVRVVNAVGKLDPKIAPRLSSLVNCVVFPVQGHRSLPSCLGGGDLDGDLFTVIGLPELIPDRAQVHSPASYQAPEMRKLDQDCTIADGADFFLDYISSDLVGMIATRHLHIADQAVEGTLNRSCLRLAELHSDAVDYPKTGVPVNIRSLPSPPAKMKPDYMCQEYDSSTKGEDYYESARVLGRLFREIPASKIDVFVNGTRLDDDIVELDRYNRSLHSFGNHFSSRLDPKQILTKLITNQIQLKFPTNHKLILRKDDDLRTQFEVLLGWFAIELMKISKLNNLSSSSLGSESNGKNHLSESEAFMGVILMSSDKFSKRTALSRLIEETKHLYGLIRSSIISNDDDDDDDDDQQKVKSNEVDELDEQQFNSLDELILHRAFQAWSLATHSQSNLFGTHSFGFICLDIILSLILD
ncbi:hypothetical protein MJO29_007957 [Puccinia striiformis f. sp. tritici]|nr:hypothetical protein MJO29_007957 [Puccinia striiformis f. sp. tritici]